MLSPFEQPILVTRPFLPPFDEFTKGLKEIWDSKWLTNDGPVLKRYEQKLMDYLRTDNLCLFNNGTLALQIALQGLSITGEVITTPFTFVATTHALTWNNIRPVFCDIEPNHFTLDPDKVEALITPFTRAILPVHVFGHPCNLDRFAEIARKHNIKLIYDAAHAFGVSANGFPISHYGDVSMFSFHATKKYHSFEGGMLTFKEHVLKDQFNYLKNFGFKNETEVVMTGTNAKMTEVHALMGEQVLGYMDSIIQKAKEVEQRYRECLADVPGITFCPPLPRSIQANHAYIPVQILKEEFGMSRDDVYEELKKFNIFARRYFFPLVSDFACYKWLPATDPLPVARQVAHCILNLPTYFDLSLDDVEKICTILKYLAKK